MRLVALALIAACGPRAGAARVAMPHEGISLAIYAQSDGAGFGVVDDRRWIAIADGTIVLDRIDAEAALPSLVIEALDRAPLQIGACVRERVTEVDAAQPLTLLSPIVRCRVDGTPGRRFVRIAYVTSRLVFEPRHDVEVRGERAQIATRYTIATPRWQRAGEVALFHGVPGGPRGARELARGAITLDGGTAVLSAQPREVPARIRYVFDGALRDSDDDPRSEAWGESSRPQVMAWLELGGALERGRAHVRIVDEAREVAVPAAARDKVAGQLRLPLWIDDQLIGRRERRSLSFDARNAAEDVRLSISNHSAVPREVWLEERLRPARERTIRGLAGPAPAIVGNVARAAVTVAPGTTMHVDFVAIYTF